MKFFKSAFLSFFLIFSSHATADQYKTVNQTDSGMKSTYWQVPSDFKCSIKDDNAPTAFCKGPGKVIYHLAGLASFQGTVNPDQYIDNLIKEILNQANIKIIKRYDLPEVRRHLLQQDRQMLYRNGQQTYTYVFDAKNLDENDIGLNLFVVNILPNNGSPMTVVKYYGLSMPSSKTSKLKKIRQQFVKFMLSKRYDNQYLQALNSQHLQFQSNLSARQRNFTIRQNQIHQNNMDALDSSHNAYQQRSAASDRMQSQSVDSIYERQQMIDPNTGTKYQVEGYYDYNYVNPNDPDNYRQSNDALYNPNINTNQGEYYNQLQEYNE